MERLPLSKLYKLQDSVSRAVTSIDPTARVHVDEGSRRVVVTTSSQSAAVADVIDAMRPWGPIRYAEDRRLAS
jgi:hypothetical protein